MLSNTLLNYLASPDTPDLHREIIFVLKEHGAFGVEKFYTIDEMSEFLGKSKDYIGRELGVLTSVGFLSRSFKEFQSEKSTRVYRQKAYSLSRQHMSNVAQTELPDKVYTTQQEQSKIPKPKEKKPAKKLQEVFDLFNQELVKVFGESRKLQILNPKREKSAKQLLDTGMDLQKLFAGFFKHRKDSGNEYLDLDYVLRNPEVYLNYTGPVSQEDLEAERAKQRRDREAEKSKEFLASQNQTDDFVPMPDHLKGLGSLVKGID